MKKRSIISLCFLLFLFGLLASLPARTVVQLLPLPAQGVYLSGVDGPWYSGTARLLQVKTPQGLLQFNNAQWRLQWAALLSAKVRLGLQAQFDNRPMDAVVATGLDRVLHVNDLNADVNLETIRPFMQQLSVPVSGAVSVRDLALRMPANARWPEYVQGRAMINNIVASLPMALLDLGSASLDLTGNADSLNIDVSDYQGHYGLSGRIKLTPPNRYTLNLKVRPDGTIDEQTVNGMRFILGSSVDGAYLMYYSGTW